jgi:hypothetical protein
MVGRKYLEKCITKSLKSEILRSGPKGKREKR